MTGFPHIWSMLPSPKLPVECTSGRVSLLLPELSAAESGLTWRTSNGIPTTTLFSLLLQVLSPNPPQLLSQSIYSDESPVSILAQTWLLGPHLLQRSLLVQNLLSTTETGLRSAPLPWNRLSLAISLIRKIGR